jgi:glycopeptide antibiotics resistance protein
MAKKLNKLYVLIGVPGSGKSTWIKNQKWTDTCVIVSTDEFVEEYAKSVGKTYSEVFNDYMSTAVSLMLFKQETQIKILSGIKQALLLKVDCENLICYQSIIKLQSCLKHLMKKN